MIKKKIFFPLELIINCSNKKKIQFKKFLIIILQNIIAKLVNIKIKIKTKNYALER